MPSSRNGSTVPVKVPVGVRSWVLLRMGAPSSRTLVSV
jgi:hypothetical protein